MARQHRAGRSKLGHHSRMEPYQWLGAGAVALGLGIAVANGTGLAYADDETGSVPSSASSHDLSDGEQDTGNGGDSNDVSGDENSDSVEHDDEKAAESEDSEDSGLDLESDDDLDLDDGPGSDDLGADGTDTAATLTLVEEAPEPEPAEVATVEAEPVVPTSDVSEVLPELTGEGTAPEVPAPPVAPTLNEIVVAAYRPTTQRGVSSTPAALQTTSESVSSGPAPLAAAAAAPADVVDRVPLGNGLPYAVIASPDGRRVFVITMTGLSGTTLPTSTVYGIDTATNRPLGDPVTAGYVLQGGFSMSAKPYTFSPDGKRLFVSAVGQGDDGRIYSRVVVIDATSGQPAGDAIDLGNTTTTGLVVSPDGRRLYTANTDSTVTVIDLEHDNIQVATIPIGVFSGAVAGGALDIVISQNDAQTVYVSDYAERAVYVIDPATSTVDPNPILTDGYPMALALSPDGSKLFITTMTFQPLGSTTNQASLVVVDAATKSIVMQSDFGNLSTAPATNGVILVGPDGRYVYTESFTNTPGGTPSGTLWKIDTATGTVQSLVSGVFPSPPVLSPDGSRLYIPTATVVGGEAQMAIGVVSTVDGTMLDRIAIDSGALTSAAVSPDGKRLYLGQMLGSLGGDPTSLTGQLAVVDTGTSNAVTPPRAVNPITLIVRSVTNAVRVSVEAIAHAIRQTVSTVTALVSVAGGVVNGVANNIVNFVRSGAFETGLALVQFAQTVSRVGGEVAGYALTAVEVSAAAIAGRTNEIGWILAGAAGDLLSAARSRFPLGVGFLVGQAVNIWAYVGQQIARADFSDPLGTLRYAVANPAVTAREFVKAGQQVGLEVATSVIGGLLGTGKKTTALVDDVTRIAGKTLSGVGNAVGQAARTTATATTRAATAVVNTVGRAVTATTNTVVRGFQHTVRNISKWRPWPFG